MLKYVIQSKQAEPPQGAYSQGWRAGDFIFLPGTGPVDPATGKIAGDTIEEQTEKTIDNIAAVLEADGASLGDVVKVTAHLSDPGLFGRYNAVYARRFRPSMSGADNGGQRPWCVAGHADRNRLHRVQTRNFPTGPARRCEKATAPEWCQEGAVGSDGKTWLP